MSGLLRLPVARPFSAGDDRVYLQLRQPSDGGSRHRGPVGPVGAGPGEPDVLRDAWDHDEALAAIAAVHGDAVVAQARDGAWHEVGRLEAGAGQIPGVLGRGLWPWLAAAALMHRGEGAGEVACGVGPLLAARPVTQAHPHSLCRRGK